MSPFSVVPEWVHVWWWARNRREPPISADRVFPQQAESAYEPTMTAEEYAALHAEWVEAGSPQVEISKRSAAAA